MCDGVSTLRVHWYMYASSDCPARQASNNDVSCVLMQLIEQLDAELGIEKFRTELESSRVLVRLLCRGHGTAHASVQATCATCDVGTHVENLLFLFLMSKIPLRP